MPFRKEICLNGEWGFLPEGAKRKRKICVPSQWTHGECFGYPKEWEKVKKAAYFRDVKLPEYNQNNDLFIFFGAVLLKCKVFADGLEIGGHEGGFTPFSLELPEVLRKEKAGKKIGLKVEVESAAAAFTDDGVMHQVGYPDAGEEGPIPGGIWQSVCLVEKPKISIENWRSEFYLKGRNVKLEFLLTNSSFENFTGELEFSIKSEKNIFNSGAKTVRIEAGKEKKTSFEFVLSREAGLWSSFAPNLYKLEMKLKGKKTVDATEDKIGFREVKIKGGDILINSAPTRMFGLSFIRQRVAPCLWHEDYLRLYFSELKKMGFNALRLHGAIAPRLVLKLADEMGIMLINQSSIWTGVEAGYRKGGGQFLENTKKEFTDWFMRDRNSPSVIIWDVENEQVSVNIKNLKWVNELISFMRDLTKQPISASASGAASNSDIIHMHCSCNMNRYMNSKPEKPFFAGEWWGPEKEYRKKMHTPARKINDVKSMEDIEKIMGEFHEKEILLQRKAGAAGTFPFATELFLFRPLFKKGEKLNVKTGGPTRPFLKFAESYSGYSYHTPRRLLVNPGWVKSKPPFLKADKVAAAFKRAFAPVVVIENEENLDFYENEKISRTFTVINDSGSKISGEFLCFFALRGKTFPGKINGKKELVLSPGEKKEVSILLELPQTSKVVDGKFAAMFVINGKSHVRKLDYRIWPRLNKIRADLPVFVNGVKENTKIFLKKAGIKFIETSKVPKEKALLIIGASSFGLREEQMFRFIEAGGQAIVLKQEKYPDFISPPFKFKSADSPIKEIHEGIQTKLKQMNLETRCRILNKKHAVFNSFPASVIRPFANGDYRTVDDAYCRPCVSPVKDPGAYRILAEGADRSQIAVAETNYGKGTILFNQLHLEENFMDDPQADRLFFNMMNYAFSYKRKSVKLFCSDKKLEKNLKAMSSSCPFSHELEESDIAIISGKKIALARKGSQLRKWIESGGTAFILASESISGFYKKIQVKEKSLLATINDPKESHMGWNSLDIDKLLEEKPLKAVLQPCKDFKAEIDVYSHTYEDPYGGASIGRKSGAALISGKLGRGKFYASTLDINRIENRLEKALWRSILSFLEVDNTARPLFENNIATAVKTPSIPFDGDILKWYNEEEDKHIAPWSRAQSVIIDSRHIVKEAGPPLEKNSNAAVCSFMFNEKNLYFSALMIADDFDLDEIEIFSYNKDSIQIFFENSQLILSSNNAGEFFVDLRDMPEGVEKEISGNIQRFDSVPSFPDLTDVKLDSSGKLKSYFIEAKIPFCILPFKPNDVKIPMAIALNISAKKGKSRRAQYSFPANFQWDDPSTFGELKING